jgi:hypothetical protein
VSEQKPENETVYDRIRREAREEQERERERQQLQKEQMKRGQL